MRLNSLAGVAYCEATRDDVPIDNIKLVTEWPGSYGGGTKEKVPSEISYDSNDGNVLWGCEIPPRNHRHVWTKLELDENKRSEELNALLELLSG